MNVIHRSGEISSSYLAFMSMAEAIEGNVDSRSKAFPVTASRAELHDFMRSLDGLIGYRVSSHDTDSTVYVYGRDGVPEVVVNAMVESIDSRADRTDPVRLQCRFTVMGREEAIQAVASRVSDFIEDHPIEERLSAIWAQLDPRGGIRYVNFEVKKQETFHPEVYPWIGDVDSFIDGFAASDSNVLILNGEPGGGKSHFINRILHRKQWSSVVAYDPEVMERDDLFSDFVRGGSSAEKVMVLEDADLLLQGRAEDGNKAMAKLLNVADGILDVSRKKFIFTANLHSVRDIDPALTRPGRCYDIIDFRPLTRAEAEKASEAIGRPLYADKDEYTVAELFNGRSNANERLKSGKVGF